MFKDFDIQRGKKLESFYPRYKYNILFFYIGFVYKSGRKDYVDS